VTIAAIAAAITPEPATLCAVSPVDLSPEVWIEPVPVRTSTAPPLPPPPPDRPMLMLPPANVPPAAVMVRPPLPPPPPVLCAKMALELSPSVSMSEPSAVTT
jgi:hypothetical protein